MKARQPLSPISPFKLERYFARWEFSAPYLLCTSDVQGVTMKELLALADEETTSMWENLTLGYTETLGLPALRAEIARLYDTVEVEDVICFAGAEEAIYTLNRVLLSEGDHLIATFPGYQSSYSVAESIGARVSKWMLRPEKLPQGQTTWQVDLDELRGALRPETRMVAVNFPHNPTGALPDRKTWEALVQIVRENGSCLFSDEVYRLMEYDAAKRLPAAVDCDENAVSLGVMSKPFGLAGLRIGWLASHNRSLLQACAAFKDYTTICSSAPSEVLALIGLRARDQLLSRSMQIIQPNLKRVEDFMASHQDWFEWIAPQAGSIAFPRWRGEMPVEQFADALVQAEGVLILPASVYDYAGQHFRLGLGRTNIPAALERVDRFLSGGVYRAAKN